MGKLMLPFSAGRLIKNSSIVSLAKNDPKTYVKFPCVSVWQVQKSVFAEDLLDFLCRPFTSFSFLMNVKLMSFLINYK